MKNLQNYAKNVQLVKRNIILCVASCYIASFPFLNWDNGGGRFWLRKIRRRWTLVGRLQKSKNEREAMSIMKYILLKWRRGEDFVDRERGEKAMEIKKGLPTIVSFRGLRNVGSFENFLFASFLVADRFSPLTSAQDVWRFPSSPRFILRGIYIAGVKVMT